MVSQSAFTDIDAVQHIGMSVRNVRRTVEFWRNFAGVEPAWEKVVDGPYLGDITGYPGVHLNAAMIELPGGTWLEILDYQVPDKEPNDPSTANPGNVHLCLHVIDIHAVWARAMAAGATAVSPGPVEVTEGPNRGAKVCYLREPDGITIELFQSQDVVETTVE